MAGCILHFYSFFSVNILARVDFLVWQHWPSAWQAKPRPTRTVRKSDYAPALALPKHMARILDEKCREKEKYREKQIEECPFSIPVITCHCEPVYQIWSFYLKRLWRYLWWKIRRERKRNKYKEEQIGECPFAIPQYNLLLRTCIPNLKFLS